MAGLDSEPLDHCERRHDGAAACRLCSTTVAEAGHAWCAAMSGLVCGDCCDRVLHGDVRRLFLARAAADVVDRPESIIAACLECERGRRWFTTELRRSTTGPGAC